MERHFHRIQPRLTAVHISSVLAHCWILADNAPPSVQSTQEKHRKADASERGVTRNGSRESIEILSNQASEVL